MRIIFMMFFSVLIGCSQSRLGESGALPVVDDEVEYTAISAPFNIKPGTAVSEEFVELQKIVSEWFSEWRQVNEITWENWQPADTYFPSLGNYYVTSGPSSFARANSSVPESWPELGVNYAWIWVRTGDSWSKYKLPFTSDKIDKEASCNKFLVADLYKIQLYSITSNGPKLLSLPVIFDRINVADSGNWIAISVEKNLIFYGDIVDGQLRTIRSVPFDLSKHGNSSDKVAYLNILWNVGETVSLISGREITKSESALLVDFTNGNSRKLAVDRIVFPNRRRSSAYFISADVSTMRYVSTLDDSGSVVWTYRHMGYTMYRAHG